jgi:hypothetical protein
MGGRGSCPHASNTNAKHQDGMRIESVAEPSAELDSGGDTKRLSACLLTGARATFRIPLVSTGERPLRAQPQISLSCLPTQLKVPP